MSRKPKAAEADHPPLVNQGISVSQAAPTKRAQRAKSLLITNAGVPARLPTKAAEADQVFDGNQPAFVSAAAPQIADDGPLMGVRKHHASIAKSASPKASDVGHSSIDTQARRADTLASPIAAAGHLSRDAHTIIASGGKPKASGGGHVAAVPHWSDADTLAPIIAEIRAWHRDRVFAMEQRKRSDLALGAFLRRLLGWSRELPKAEAVKINKQAGELIALGEKIAAGKANAIGNPIWGQCGAVVLASVQGRTHWDAIESNACKEMERLAKSLPAWANFGEEVKGFGARSLAVIVGEAGDLSNYANPGKLWKRMGLAVMSGIRQGGLRKTASAEDWIAHGYNAKRRSCMFVIGDCLVKNKGEYREVYLARKQYERDRAIANGLTVCPAAKIPKKRQDEFMSDGHIHRRAQRYMEKRLLKHLWQAWRRPNVQVKPMQAVAAAD